MMRLYFNTGRGRCRRNVVVRDRNGWEPVRTAWEERDPGLVLTSVTWGNDPPVVSKIRETWTLSSIMSYQGMCLSCGEEYFLLCEALGKRDAAMEWEGSRECGVFGSLAEAGEAIAEEFLGITPGVMQYVDAVRLASDIMNGKGPAEIPEGLIVTGNTDRFYIRILDESAGQGPEACGRPDFGM